MLLMPTLGSAKSVREHNGDLGIFCDWIEASVLFCNEELSVSDIVDALIEHQRYYSQDFAREWVQNGWQELQRRQKWIGNGCAYSIDARWIKRTTGWTHSIAHTFCILLSLATYYDWWVAEFGHDYTEQGFLFECLTLESLQAQFADWEVYATGWSRSNTVRLDQVVDELANRLGEVKGRVDLWIDSRAKDLGLDLLWYRPFPDNRTGIHVYLTQCASGANWRTKLKTPDLEAWGSVIQFTTKPKRAFAAPFSFLDKEFSQNCILTDGVLLDRSRLLCAYRHRQEWVSDRLKQAMVTWVEPRVKTLLYRSS